MTKIIVQKCSFITTLAKLCCGTSSIVAGFCRKLVFFNMVWQLLSFLYKQNEDKNWTPLTDKARFKKFHRPRLLELGSHSIYVLR